MGESEVFQLCLVLLLQETYLCLVGLSHLKISEAPKSMVSVMQPIQVQNVKYSRVAKQKRIEMCIIQSPYIRAYLEVEV